MCVFFVGFFFFFFFPSCDVVNGTMEVRLCRLQWSHMGPKFINIDRPSAVPLFKYLDRVVEVGTSCKIRLNIVCIKSKWTTVTTL
jgi:hypothetical protein